MSKVIDANAVFGSDRLTRIPMQPDDLLRTMDRVGIDQAVITCTECTFYDFTEGNNLTAAVVHRHPDRFIGFLSFHAARFLGLPEEVDRCLELGLRGIRLFCTESLFVQGWSSGLASLVLQTVLERANALRLPVFIEAGFPFVDMLRLARLYPETSVIASGIGYPNAGEAILAAQQAENLFLDISTLDMAGGIDLLVEKVGDEKLVFGSGMPYNAPSSQLFMVRYAEIGEGAKAQILGLNMQRLLDRGRLS